MTNPPKNFTLSLMAGVYILAQIIVVPALPELQKIFSTDYKTIQLSIAVFLLGAAIVNIIAGPLSDRFGRRPIALIFYVIFFFSSLGAFLSDNISLFLFFRFLQSSSAAGMVLARAIVGDIYSTKEATVMFGYISIVMALGPLVGPFLGGLITENFGAINIFTFLAILGFTIFLLAFFDLKETNSKKSASFFKQLKNYPTLLTSIRFWPPTIVSCFSFSIFSIFFVGGPFVATYEYSLSPILTGLYFAFPPIGFIIGNLLISKFPSLYSIKVFLFYGAFLVTLGPVAILVLTSFSSSPMAFFIPVIIITTGTGIIWPIANTEIVKSVPSLGGSASGISSALMVIISAIASGIVGTTIELYQPISIVVSALVIVGIITLIGSFFIREEGKN